MIDLISREAEIINGEWIPVSAPEESKILTVTWWCSNCHRIVHSYTESSWNYCPNCDKEIIILLKET